MSAGSSSATGHAHAQQPQQQEDQEDLFPPDNFSMVDAGIYRSESRVQVQIRPQHTVRLAGHWWWFT